MLRAIQLLCLSGLCCFCVLSLLGSVLAFREVPAAAALNQNDAALVATLERLGISHIYTDYWTCDKIAFESNEQITCAVLTSTMRVDNDHYNRYTPYIAEVNADPRAAYALPIDQVDQGSFTLASSSIVLNDPDQPAATLPVQFRTNYIRIVTYNYVLYVPREGN